jgi:hypothetical protein
MFVVGSTASVVLHNAQVLVIAVLSTKIGSGHRIFVVAMKLPPVRVSPHSLMSMTGLTLWLCALPKCRAVIVRVACVSFFYFFYFLIICSFSGFLY